MKAFVTTGLALLLCVPLAAAVDPQLDNNAMTTEHNAVRMAVNAGTWFGQPVPVNPLGNYAFSAALATSAQAVADTCNFVHSVTPNGENLYAGAATNAPVAWTANGVVQASWSGEAADYTYATNTCAAGKDCGHYTQVVWASPPTPSVGCGATQCAMNSPFMGFTNWVFVVCQYSPAGNVVGQQPYCVPGATGNCALPVELLEFSID